MFTVTFVYGDSATNNVQENPSIFSLMQMHFSSARACRQ